MSFKNFKSKFLTLVFISSFIIPLGAKKYYNKNAKKDTLMNIVKNPGAEQTGYWIPNWRGIDPPNLHDTTQAHSGEASFMLDATKKPATAVPNIFYRTEIYQNFFYRWQIKKISDVENLNFWIRLDKNLEDSLMKKEGYFELELGDSEKCRALIYYTKPKTDTSFEKDTETKKFIRTQNFKNNQWINVNLNIKQDWIRKFNSDAELHYIFIREKGILKKETFLDTVKEKWYGEKINVDDISLICKKYWDPAVLWVEIPSEKDTVYGPFEPKAYITNYGKRKQNCIVNCTIYDKTGISVYLNAINISNLTEGIEISFPMFETEKNGFYTLNLFVDALREDEDTTNNLMNIPFYYKHLLGIEKKLRKESPSFKIKNSKIEYYLPKKSKISFDIYNSSGRIVEKIDKIENFGKHKFDLRNQDFSSGIYFIKFKTENYEKIKKIVLIH